MASVWVSAMTELLPVSAWMVIVLVAAVAAAAFLVKRRVEDDEISVTTLRDRLDRSLVFPVAVSGSRESVWLFNKATDNTTRRVGKIKKVNSKDIGVKLEDEVAANTSVTMEVLRAGEGFGWRAGFLLSTVYYKLAGKVSRSDRNPAAEYMEVGTGNIVFGDGRADIKPGCHLVKKEGVWMDMSRESQEVVKEVTMFDAHFDFMNTVQQLADVYAHLNREVQKSAAIMGTKWDNISRYKHGEERAEKKDAMES